MSINNFKDLLVWQKAVDLSVNIYKLTEKFPKSEIYGLTSQLRRAAVSIPSNIAEGQRRGTKKDFTNFLNIARGSCAEVETQINISNKLDFIDQKGSENIIYSVVEISKMLYAIISRLEK